MGDKLPKVIVLTVHAQYDDWTAANIVQTALEAHDDVWGTTCGTKMADSARLLDLEAEKEKASAARQKAEDFGVICEGERAYYEGQENGKHAALRMVAGRE